MFSLLSHETKGDGKQIPLDILKIKKSLLFVPSSGHGVFS
jgi:hypothetical protein